MGHGHGHGGHGGQEAEAPVAQKKPEGQSVSAMEQAKLRKAVYFAVFMMVTEIICGIIANALAIIADAAHMMSDVGGFVVSIICIKLASRAATQQYTYGFRQAEVLGALANILIVWILTGILLYEAIRRMSEPEEVNAPLMFAIAVLGFVVNLCLMGVLGHGHGHGGHGHSHGGGHGHGLRRVVANANSSCGGHGEGHAGHGDDGHGHSHGGGHGHVDSGCCDHGEGHAGHGDGAHSDRGGHAEHGGGHAAIACEHDADGGGEDHESTSLAMRGAIVHVIGDTVQSLGVIVASILIWWRPLDVGFTAKGVSKWNYADPCCTITFGILVLLTTRGALIHALTLVMIKAPSHIDQGALLDKLGKCPSVQSVHDLHVWTVGSNDVMCTAHLMVEGANNAMPALIAAIKIAKSMGIVHSTFQTEIVGLFDPALETYGIHDNPLSKALGTSIGKSTVEDISHGHGHGQADGDCRDAPRQIQVGGNGHEECGDEEGHGHGHSHGHSRGHSHG